MAQFERRSGILIAAGILALVLPGCASISRNECVTADWYAIGYETGIRGQHETQITRYRKACAEHGITPDLARFLEGRDAGLQRFCEPRNGYRLGRAGTAYGGVCPQGLEGGFVQAYRAGREVYDAQQEIERLGRIIHKHEAELKRLNEAVAEAQAELIAVETTTQRRVLLLKELLDLQEKVRQAEYDLRDARAARERERGHLSRLERRRSSW